LKRNLSWDRDRTVKAIIPTFRPHGGGASFKVQMGHPMLQRPLMLLTTLCLAAACTGTGAIRVVEPGAPLSLSVGDEVELSGHGTVRYVAVREDSRCRPEQVCVWAGDAKVDFDISERGSAPRRLTLHGAEQTTGRGGALAVSSQTLDFSRPPLVTVRIHPG